MAKQVYTLNTEDLNQVDRFVTRSSNSDAGKRVTKSLLIQVVGMIGKPVRDITIDDIFTVRDRIMKEDFKDNYRRRLVFAMKKFFQWQFKMGKVDTSEIDSLKLPRGQWKTKSPKDMLKPKDVEKIIGACQNPRDRCFIAMLWDGSNRPIELLKLTWGELIQDEYGYYFLTDKKTKRERHIRLTTSVPYVDEWKKYYPGTPDDGNPVFVTVHRAGDTKTFIPWNIDAAQAMILHLKEKLGYKKLNLSLFRPSRITHDVKAGYDLPYIMKKNWGHLKTPMIDLYTNVDGEYIDQVALRQAGMSRREDTKAEKQYELEPPVCPHCGTMNTMGSSFCSRCQKSLTGEPDTGFEALQQEKEALRMQMAAQTVKMQEMTEMMDAMSRAQHRLSAVVDKLRKEEAPAPMDEPLPDEA